MHVLIYNRFRLLNMLQLHHSREISHNKTNQSRRARALVLSQLRKLYLLVTALESVNGQRQQALPFSRAYHVLGTHSNWNYNDGKREHRKGRSGGMFPRAEF